MAIERWYALNQINVVSYRNCLKTVSIYTLDKKPAESVLSEFNITCKLL